MVDGALIAAARYNELRYNEGMFQIHSVERGSYGSRAVLFSHAYIVAINGRKPETVEEIYKALSTGKEAKFMLRYWSNDQYLHNFYEVVFEPDEVELMNAM